MTPAGRLVLVPNALDHGTGEVVDLREVLPQAVIERAAGLRHWVVENAKTARAFLARVAKVVPLAQPLQQVEISELPRARKGAAAMEAPALEPLLAPLLAGHDLGLLSEAGLPAVADPGAALVRLAHQRGLAVLPLAGPSSLMLALAASGLDGQHFSFVGYLPVDARARAQRVRELELASRRFEQTQIAIETPYRNSALLRALVEVLQPTTRLAVASGVTLAAGSCRSATIADWRTHPGPISDRVPAVFLFQAE
jgi:16S rRNA (cytidine1402-2'-O)-methyltransferase